MPLFQITFTFKGGQKPLVLTRGLIGRRGSAHVLTIRLYTFVAFDTDAELPLEKVALNLNGQERHLTGGTLKWDRRDHSLLVRLTEALPREAFGFIGQGEPTRES